MTDLTAYEQALVERVEQAFALWRDPADSPRTSALLALASLGLLGPNRTAWIAPWEATADVIAWGMDRTMYANLRDAHLKEGGA